MKITIKSSAYVTDAEINAYRSNPSAQFRNRLAVRLLPLVRFMANSKAYGDYQQFYDDYFQVGAIAVLRVLDNIAMGNANYKFFKAFVCGHIRSAISNYQRSARRKLYAIGGQKTLILSPVEEDESLSLPMLKMPYREENGDLILYSRLDRLPEQYRQIVFLTFFKNCTRGEIAIQLGLSRRKVSQVLDLAVQQLQELFGVELENPKGYLQYIKGEGKLAAKNQERCNKQWHLTSPEEESFEIVNLNNFCALKGLNSASMIRVANGDRTHYRGWKCARLSEKRTFKEKGEKCNEHTF